MQLFGLNKTRNPHFTRLTRHVHATTDGPTLRGITTDWVLVSLIGNCFCVACTFSGFNFTWVFLGLLVGVVLPVPVLVAMYMAWFTARDAATPHYELTTLTGISNQQLVWGYIQAPFVTFKAYRGFPLGLMPFFATIIGCGFFTTALLSQLALSAEAPQPANMVNFMAGSTALIVSYLGVYWFSVVLGVAMGLALRQAFLSLLLTAALAGMVMPLWSLASLLVLNPFDYNLARLGFNPLWLVMAALPLGLVWLTLRRAYFYARHPLRG